MYVQILYEVCCLLMGRKFRQESPFSSVFIGYFVSSDLQNVILRVC